MVEVHMPKATHGITGAWRVVRILIIVLALPTQSLFARGQTPNYCDPQTDAHCEYGGLWASDRYCEDWWSCETCCEIVFAYTCNGRVNHYERNGDGSCGPNES
jgi:hypothetical protein